MRFSIASVLVVFAALTTPALALAQEHHHHMPVSATPLTAPGNDAFAAIQEVVEKLLADPNTDWSRVNLEALRQHLVDMHNFTLNVELIAQSPIDGGVEFTVKPTTLEATGSLERLFNAHPAILKQESGWIMTATRAKDGSFTARVTSTRHDDVAKIRGLGYIGIVAYGKHHQAHHWQMATGGDPHQH